MPHSIQDFVALAIIAVFVTGGMYLLDKLEKWVSDKTQALIDKALPAVQRLFGKSGNP